MKKCIYCGKRYFFSRRHRRNCGHYNDYGVIVAETATESVAEVIFSSIGKLFD